MLVLNLNLFKKEKVSFLRLPDIDYQDDKVEHKVQQNSMNKTYL